MVFRVGSPGYVTLSIRPTTGAHPDSSGDLCSDNSQNGDTWGTSSSSADWSFSPPGVVLALTKYAIVMRAPDGNVSNNARWGENYPTDGYAGGNPEFSTDSGSNWSTTTGREFMFENWGDPYTAGGAATKNLTLLGIG